MVEAVVGRGRDRGAAVVQRGDLHDSPRPGGDAAGDAAGEVRQVPRPPACERQARGEPDAEELRPRRRLQRRLDPRLQLRRGLTGRPGSRRVPPKYPRVLRRVHVGQVFERRHPRRRKARLRPKGPRNLQRQNGHLPRLPPRRRSRQGEGRRQKRKRQKPRRVQKGLPRRPRLPQSHAHHQGLSWIARGANFSSSQTTPNNPAQFEEEEANLLLLLLSQAATGALSSFFLSFQRRSRFPSFFRAP
mmetsp:Transcript_38154/g.122479  ORF Transcript_38154/g.122479 Transcript_38154/m.122479 type:complete len:245 (-) Transcript_38154:49-783(-)